jgi:SAM-dependent methyltransferase
VAGAYIFGDADHERELERLRALERAFDGETRRWLEELEPRAGWRCVEVGAGAGSIARWMREQVGPEGKVLAIDLDPRFLAGMAAPGLEIFGGDVRDLGGTTQPADLVHARFVLIHQTEPRPVLEAMIRLLKPGGWLVVEEADFSLASPRTGSREARASFESVKRAIAAMFERRGMDARFGSRVPALLADLGLDEVATDVDVPSDRGGGVIASMMAMSTRHLRDRYVATGLATPSDIEGYLAFTADPSCSAIYHGVVRARARRPRHPVEETT